MMAFLIQTLSEGMVLALLALAAAGGVAFILISLIHFFQSIKKRPKQ